MRPLWQGVRTTNISPEICSFTNKDSLPTVPISHIVRYILKKKKKKNLYMETFKVFNPNASTPAAVSPAVNEALQVITSICRSWPKSPQSLLGCRSWGWYTELLVLWSMVHRVLVLFRVKSAALFRLQTLDRWPLLLSSRCSFQQRVSVLKDSCTCQTNM